MSNNATAVAEKERTMPSAAHARNLALLAGIVAGIPLAALVVAFLVVNTSFFKKYADSQTVSSQQFLFETKNQPCDVLIFGDSTAMAGLDPSIVEGVTHLHACNFATNATTLGVMGMEPFSLYLTRNPKPKYLVLQFASQDLHETKPETAHLDHFDGVILSMRYKSWSETYPLFLHNPDYFIGLMNYVYRTGAIQLASSLRHSGSNAVRRDSYFVMPRPALKSCALFASDPAMPDPSWIQALRQRYTGAADHLIVDVSPTSSCNTLYPQWKSSLGNATDNSLELYPNNLFVDGSYHTSREGAIRRSNELAQQILGMEQQKPETPAGSAKALSQ